MEAPILSASHLRPITNPIPVAATQKLSSAAILSSSDNQVFRSVCHNWALKVSKEKQVSLSEAFDCISKTVAEKSKDEAKKTALLHAMQGLNWENDPVFNDTEEYPFYALACLKEGTLSVEQFSTIMFYRTCVLYHGDKKAMQSVPMFKVDRETKEPKINPLAREIVKKTCAPLKMRNEQMREIQQEVPQLSDPQIEAFFDQMSKRPVSEQQFFVMPDTYIMKETLQKFNLGIDKFGDKLLAGKNLSDEQLKFFKDQIKSFDVVAQGENRLNRPIIEIFYQDQGFNPLNFFHEQGVRKRMVPSLSMMQVFVDTKHPNTVRINPVIGVSPLEAICENALTRSREMALEFVDFPLPSTADTKAAPGFDFTYHDFYHVNMFAYIPQKHVDASLKFIEILQSIKNHKDLIPQAELIERIMEQTIDLEGIAYQPVSLKALDEEALKSIFWRMQAQIIEAALTHLSLKSNPDNLQMEVQSKAIALEASGFYKIFAEEVSKHAAFFDSKGINLNEIHALAEVEKENLKEVIRQAALKAIENIDPFMAIFVKPMIEEQLKPAYELVFKLNFLVALSESLKRLSP
jgi:hypothetical protein